MNVCSIFKRLGHTDAMYLLAAVCDTYDHMDASGDKPGAEKWHSDTRYFRPQMCDRVTARWCEIAGLEEYEFPFHPDFVASTWVMFRKESEGSKDAVRRELLGRGLS